MKSIRKLTMTAGLIAAGLVFQTVAQAATVTYDPSAPESNFGTPGPSSDNVGYTINVSSDPTYVHIDLDADLSTAINPTLDFVNLYLSTTVDIPGEGNTGGGHGVGFEIGNNDAFEPGGSGTYSTSGDGFVIDHTTPGVWDISIPWTYFETDPDGIGFTKITAANQAVRVNMSQAFGYSVAGGSADFGFNQLGVANLPDSASTMSLLGVGVAGLAFLRRRMGR